MIPCGCTYPRSNDLGGSWPSDSIHRYIFRFFFFFFRCYTFPQISSKLAPFSIPLFPPLHSKHRRVLYSLVVSVCSVCALFVGHVILSLRISVNCENVSAEDVKIYRARDPRTTVARDGWKRNGDKAAKRWDAARIADKTFNRGGRFANATVPPHLLRKQKNRNEYREEEEEQA